MFNRKSRKDLEEEIKVLRERLGVESRMGKSLTVDVYLLTGKLKEAGDAYERGFLEGLDFEEFVTESEEAKVESKSVIRRKQKQRKSMLK